ncbi:MAG: amino acid adenylation domain-containing protein [Betaproteobacteria bacterium]|nr:amino acid adenylation domain-containing protein [Betaproteobacteria bacterium]
MQHRLWILEQLDPGRAIFNTPSAHRLLGRMNVPAFRRAFAELVRRQDVLRTSIEVMDGTPMQVILPELPGDILPYEDLSMLAPADRQAALANRIAELTAQPFELANAPLFRARLLRLAEDESVFFFCAHHIIWDGWSFDILYREMSTLYAAFRDGKLVGLPELPVAYGDFADWHRNWMQGDELAAELAHWKERLSGPIETLSIPYDRPRPAEISGKGASTWILLPPEKTEAIRVLGRAADATVFMVLLAAYAAMLQRLTGQREIMVGVPVRGRQLAELDQVMGLFVNVLPLRVRVDAQASFAGLLAAVRECALDAFKHPDVPFEQLVRELNVPRDRGRFPIYQTTFSFQDARGRDFEWGNLKHELVPVYQPGIAEDIGLWLMEGPWGLQGALAYNTDIIVDTTADLLRKRFAHVLDFLLAHPDVPLAQVPLAEEEHRQILVEWNATSRPYAAQVTVDELVGAQAARTPLRRALSQGAAELSYAELEARANRLSRSLRARGARRGQCVGLCVERGIAMVVTQLAILKSGAAYVPLDPSYPPERLQFMAEDAGLAALVTESALVGLLAWPREKVLLIDADADSIGRQPDAPLGRDVDSAGPMDPAYVIYTSGSTGKPKGVQVQHRAVANFLASMRVEPGMGEGDRVLAVTTLSFDIAVLELLLPLTVGAEVVLASREQAVDPHSLMQLLDESRATLMQATPGTWRMLLDAGWKGTPGFKALIGGEALAPDLAGRLLPVVGELWNMYGPTETTVWSTCWRVGTIDSGISIGRPIANTTVWILDEQAECCPIGVPGEIWIGGDGVALGYLNRPELTAERFVADHFSGVAGARLYRTGDRGRWRSDGLLEHLGRLDSQVKVRGYRIELGEIEASLVAHSGVGQAVALVREDNPGDVRLVAYVVARGVVPSDQQLREHLRAFLPVYMIPQHFVALPAIPLLPNGKIDHASLPPPAPVPENSRATMTTPATQTEKLLGRIWCGLLKTPEVHAEDNFFDLGGHSMLVMRAVFEMESKCGKRIEPNRYIFETLGQIARAYDEAKPAPLRKPGGLRGLFAGLIGGGKHQ